MDWLPPLDILSTLRLVVVAAVGLATAFVGGMLGVGGGRPRLLVVYWAVENPVAAAGTNLGTALGGLAGTWLHFREGRVDLRVLAFLGCPSIAGAFIGGFFGGLAPRAALLAAVGVITTWYGLGLLTGRHGGSGLAGADPGSSASEVTSHESPQSPRSTSVRRHALEMGLGFAIGLFGGAVGLGLGGLRVPALMSVLGMEPRTAVGTNRAIGNLTGLFGFLGHMLHLEVELPVLLALGSGRILGSYLGARQTGRISANSLRRCMGLVMVVTAPPIFWLAYTQL